MSKTSPDKRHDADSPDLVGNAVERTDNAFDGKKDGERLIGRDIPIEEQDAEEEEQLP
ncbi:hypothetical protein LQ948_16065 [Jiella sp. MQZ9-1]|uniref:Uncharacterized protein n=1 Tax=Jiella flava TaxID=2816857 RepID=A0A939G1J5_9HYPH|nr:hypothetical protein [Jiella flava]MBO0664150.1 hypothetical protein [Jiella flava]MCD2472722.1 hypothetical protein [Jiella flava]